MFANHRFEINYRPNMFDEKEFGTEYGTRVGRQLQTSFSEYMLLRKNNVASAIKLQ